MNGARIAASKPVGSEPCGHRLERAPKAVAASSAGLRSRVFIAVSWEASVKVCGHCVAVDAWIDMWPRRS